MDISLHYIDQGKGFPLILLHGNGEDHTYFRHQITFFSQFYRVIALDTRGHGKSPIGSAPFTISQFADDLFQFMKQQQIPQAHILGFSDGGNIALTFALRYPERVKSLILNGANLFPAGMKTWVHLGVHMEYAAAVLKRDHYHASLMNLMRKEPNFSPADLRSVSQPTLVIAGNRDMIKDRHTRLIASSVPNAQLVILSGDHFLANKCPDRFNSAVQQFLSDK